MTMVVIPRNGCKILMLFLNVISALFLILKILSSVSMFRLWQ